MPVTPEFPVYLHEKWHWIAAQSNGWIVCPQAIQANLDAYLHLTFENRYAWFFRWIPESLLEIYDDWATAVLSEKCGLDAKNKEKMAKKIVINPKDFFKTVKQSDPQSIFKNMTADDRKKFPTAMEVPLKAADCYTPDTWIETDEIIAGKADFLIGKVVIAQGSYGSEYFGTLIEIEKGRNFCSIFRTYNGGSYGTSGSVMERIAAAKIGAV